MNNCKERIKKEIYGTVSEEGGIICGRMPEQILAA